MKYGGLEDLLVLYRLDGLPADFAVSGSSACVSYIFRSILEVNPTQTAAAICKEIRSSYQNLAFYFSAEPTKIIEMTDLDVNEEDKVGEAQKIFRYMVSLKCYVRLLNDIYCSGSLSHNKSFVSVVEMFKEIEGVGESPVSVLKLFSNLEEFCTTQKHSLIEKFSLKVCNPIDKKDCIPEGYEELPAKNARLLYPLVDEIPSDFISLMKGILKIVSNRKVTTSQVASCQGIIDQIANILKVNVDRATTSSAVDKQQKWHIALQNLKSMLFEERGPATISMQSFLGYSFYKCNGISTLISLLGNEDFVNSLNSLSSTSELAEPSSAEILLSILQNYVTENLVINSPYTPVLVSRHSRKIASGFFEPSAFLIDLRLLIFPEILKLFFSDNLSKFTPHSIQTIFAIIIFVLKAKGEDDQPPHMRSLANRLVSSIFGTMTTAQPAPLPQPDDTKVEFLFDMGFPRSAARIALSRCGNSVARATDYILSHPEILSEISPTVNAQTTGANVGGGSSIRVEEPLAAPENASEGAATSVLDATMPAQLDEIETSNFHDDNDVAMVSADSSEAREIPFLPLENVETQVDPKEELEKLRVSKKQEIVDRVISFVADMDPTLVFSVKEVIVCIGKKEIDKIVGRLIKSIQHNFAVLASDTESKQIVHSKLALLSHLVALIVTDHSVRKYIISSSELREFDIVALIEKVLGNEKWISPMLIILETQISFNEDPFDEPIQTDPSKFSNEIPVVKFQKPLDDPFCLAVTKIMVSLVSIEGVETDLFHAVLRILVRVTRNYDVAKYFIEIGGYSALLKLGEFAAFPNNEALLILIARNCFESPEVIQKVLERELTRFLSIPRPRTVDVSSMLKSSSHLVLRAPDAFLRAISSVYKLTNYVPSPVARSCIVALKEFAEDVSKNAATSLDLPTNSKSTPQGTPLKASFMGDKFSEGSISPVSGQLVQYLSSQLIASKNQDINSNDLHLRRCFILQIFAELILEYPSCKIDLILSSQKRKQTPKSFGKNLLLSFLLNDIIPVDMVLNTPSTSEPVATEISRKLVESTWASCVIAALCYSSGSKLEEAYKYELDTIKVIVVEAIIRSLKINKSESVPFEVQNGKLVSLADLCFKLLSAKTIVYPGQTKCSGKLESHTLSMARIMISKGLVAVLTLSLAELDIHHPGSQKVVSSIIAPLDLLSKSAIEMGKNEDLSNDNQITRKGNSLFDNAFRDLDRPGVEDTPIDISDIYRNSALGIMEPRMDAEDSDFSDSDEYDHSDEMEDTDQVLNEII